MELETQQDIRRRWLTRLGQPAVLDFPLVLVSRVWRSAPGMSIATCEIATGSVATGDELDAVGYSEEPFGVRIASIERPSSVNEVVAASSAGAGEIVGLTLEHAADAPVEPGQCLAPAGRLETSIRIATELWLFPADEVPVSGADKRRMLRHLVYGERLELFFHTREVAASPVATWAPRYGEEFALEFTLSECVPIYPGTRFGVRYDGLTIGAGFVQPTLA